MYEYIHISTLSSEETEPHCGAASVSENMPDVLFHRLNDLSQIAQSYPSLILASRQLRINDVFYPFLSYISPSFDGKKQIIHHLIFKDTAELSSCPGAAPGVLRSDNFHISGEALPEKLPVRFRLKSRKRLARRAYLWEALLGDAGWAGVVAEYFLRKPEQPVYLEYSPEYIDSLGVLELVNEVIFLLPENLKSTFTFSTAFTEDVENCICFFRAVPAGSPLSGKLSVTGNELILSQDAPDDIPVDLGGSPLIEAARKMKPEQAKSSFEFSRDDTEPTETKKTEPKKVQLFTARQRALLVPPEKRRWGWYLIITLLLLALTLFCYFFPAQDSGDNIQIIQENMQLN